MNLNEEYVIDRFNFLAYIWLLGPISYLLFGGVFDVDFKSSHKSTL